MAEGMFNFVDPRILQQAYTQQFQVPEAQFAQLPLLQQVASMGTQTGANVGSSLGRLFGGQSAMEAENAMLKDIFSKASELSADPMERLQIAAKGLREKGMEGRALQLEKQALEMQKSQAETQKAQADLVNEQNAYVMRYQALKVRNPNMAEEVARAVAQDPTAFRETLKDPEAKFEVETVDGRKKLYKVTPQGYQLVQDLGAVGSSPMDALAGSISALAAGMAAERGKKAAGAEGTEVGKAVAQIQSGYNAEAAITDALDMVTQGIYAGGYGPAQELMSKYTSGIIGDKNRLVNTEAFRAYIGNVVIPMMSQLGGSDSNEELKYMRSIVGGETTLEADAIQKILRRAREAVRKDIARKRAQQKAVEGSQPLPTGPMDNKEVNWSDL